MLDFTKTHAKLINKILPFLNYGQVKTLTSDNMPQVYKNHAVNYWLSRIENNNITILASQSKTGKTITIKGVQ